MTDDLSKFDDITFEVMPDEQIRSVFDSLADARTALCNAQNALSYKQDAYDDCKRDMILGGHVIGKNETERDAKLSDLLRVQIAQLRDAQRAERNARLNFDIARDNVERLKLDIEPRGS